VEVMDKERGSEPNFVKDKFQLVGKSETRYFKYHFDTEPSYQPCAKSGATGCTPPVTAPDITDNVSTCINIMQVYVI